jgi:hypothetical protein
MPFAQGAATLELQVLARCGLRQEVLQSLITYPHDFAEWKARRQPPWRHLFESADSEPRRNPRLAAQPCAAADNNAICLECGKVLVGGDLCPTHGKKHLYTGRYIEVIHPDGHLTWLPLGSTSVYLGRTSSQERMLSEDEALSLHHVALHCRADTIEIEDLESDNGTWLRLDRVALPAEPWLGAGLQLRMGHHWIVIRSTTSRADNTDAKQQIILLGPKYVPSEEPDAQESTPG